MTVYRTHLTYLEDWAKSAKHKPIIIRGARQVGKSTLVELLAQKLGFNLCVVNFEKRMEFAEFFASNDPKKTVELLASQLQIEITPGKTILFLDEIQAAPQVIATLRYFYEELPELHVLAAGSLLEFALEELDYSVPVGRMEYMYMGPLSFSEFLMALNEVQALQFLQNYNFLQKIPSALHEKFMNLLALYYIIGGMPEAVASYVEQRNLATVARIKTSILETLQDDFSKYSKKVPLTVLQKIFNKIPLQIGKKFQYVNVDNVTKTNIISAALDKLCRAKVAEKIFHTSANGIPLGAEANDKHFKVIFLDIGLVNSLLGVSLSSLLRSESLELINQRALAEQMIGQHLLYMRPFYETPKLFYWARERKGSAAELDYVVNMGQLVVPVEVKSGKSGTLKSLHTFLHEKNLHKAVRFNAHLPMISDDTVILSSGEKVSFKLISLPLYLVEQMYRLL